MKNQRFTDNIHGFVVFCSSKEVAFAIIRDKCRHLDVEIPKLSDIVVYVE